MNDSVDLPTSRRSVAHERPKITHPNYLVLETSTFHCSVFLGYLHRSHRQRASLLSSRAHIVKTEFAFLGLLLWRSLDQLGQSQQPPAVASLLRRPRTGFGLRHPPD